MGDPDPLYSLAPLSVLALGSVLVLRAWAQRRNLIPTSKSRRWRLPKSRLRWR